jgi:hypothetical protein
MCKRVLYLALVKTINIMSVTYLYTKEDGTKWLFWYDRAIRYWTIFQVDQEQNQIDHAQYYHDKKQLVENEGVKFSQRA